MSLSRRLVTLFCMVGASLSSPTQSMLEVAIPGNIAARGRPVEPDLFSLSIEQDNWLEWVGKTTRNDFFYNVLDNLRQLTGTPPRIRVGGRSLDVSYIDSTIQWSSVVFANATSSTPYPDALRMQLGTRFYTSARFLPEKTRVVHGLNFGSGDDMRGFFHLASIVNAYISDDSEVRKAGVVLDAIEIGNEPDNYGATGTVRDSNYDSSQYVEEWQTWAGNVQLPIEDMYSEFKLRLWGGSLSYSSHETGWSPRSLIEQGLLDSSAGERISTISQHHVGGKARGFNLRKQWELSSKSNVRDSLNPLKPDIHISNLHGLEYVLGETNSYPHHGAVGISDTAAAAIWALDYALYSSTLGVSRVFFHQGIGYRSNMVQPVPLTRSPDDGSRLPEALPPHVNAPYYAAIVGAEATGFKSSTKVTELFVDDDRIAVYAFCEDSGVARALFINSQPYLAPSAEGIFQTRPSVRVKLATDGPGFRIKRLSIPYTDSTSGMTWGNVTYETEDGLPSGIEHFETVDAREGFEISATEVVLAYF